MKFSLHQIIEIVDNNPRVISTRVTMLDQPDNLYSLAKEYLGGIEDLVSIDRTQYIGYKKGKRYSVVLMYRKDKLIIAHDPAFKVKFDPGQSSKLFPYLWETEIKTVELLHSFFNSYLANDK